MLTLFLLEQVPLSSHPALLKAFAGTRAKRWNPCAQRSGRDIASSLVDFTYPSSAVRSQ